MRKTPALRSSALLCCMTPADQYRFEPARRPDEDRLLRRCGIVTFLSRLFTLSRTSLELSARRLVEVFTTMVDHISKNSFDFLVMVLGGYFRNGPLSSLLFPSTLHSLSPRSLRRQEPDKHFFSHHSLALSIDLSGSRNVKDNRSKQGNLVRA